MAPGNVWWLWGLGATLSQHATRQLVFWGNIYNDPGGNGSSDLAFDRQCQCCARSFSSFFCDGLLFSRPWLDSSFSFCTFPNTFLKPMLNPIWLQAVQCEKHWSIGRSNAVWLCVSPSTRYQGNNICSLCSHLWSLEKSAEHNSSNAFVSTIFLLFSQSSILKMINTPFQ